MLNAPLILAPFILISIIATSIFTDISLLVYPVFLVRNRRLDIRQKISVCVLLSFGTAGTIIGIVDWIFAAQTAVQTEGMSKASLFAMYLLAHIVKFQIYAKTFQLIRS